MVSACPTPFRAQTNAQLFLQLHQHGCSSAELRLVRDAYALAMQLCTGLYTGSGKPTLAHEVGTASLALRHGGSLELVAAGLLHGAYIVGDFGHCRLQVTAAKRKTVRDVIGERAEALVYELKHLPWDAQRIAAFADGASRLSELERDVLRLKLLEELDHLLDYGAVLCFRNVPAAKARLDLAREPMCRLAMELGHPALSAEIDEAIHLTLTTELPAELLGLAFPSDSEPLVMPLSCSRRLLWRLSRFASRGKALVLRGAGLWPTPATGIDEH
jgi:uncharacterized protein DUF6817